MFSIPLLIPKKYASTEQSILNWFQMMIAQNSIYGASVSLLNDFMWVREPKTGQVVLIHRKYPPDEFIPLNAKESEMRIWEMIEFKRKMSDNISWGEMVRWIDRYGDPRIRLIGYPFRL